MSQSLISRIEKEHNRLVLNNKTPDSLFMSESSLEKLDREAMESYGVHIASGGVIFGMTVYSVKQYRDNQFRIYCKPEFQGEL